MLAAKKQADANSLKAAAEDYRDNKLTWAQIQERYPVEKNEFYAALRVLGIATHAHSGPCPICGVSMPNRARACCKEHCEIVEADLFYAKIQRGELIACAGECGRFIKPGRSKQEVCGPECRKKVEGARDAASRERFHRAIDWGLDTEGLSERFGISQTEVRVRRSEYLSRKQRVAA